MTDTTVSPYPSTPADVAAAVLDGISTDTSAFDMRYWARLPVGVPLTPAARPTCGTTLCAAGWVAHVTGWTLVELPEGEDQAVIGRHDDGTEYADYANVFAEKGDERRFIADVARDALRLANSETFWNAPAETALDRLRAIAGR